MLITNIYTDKQVGINVSRMILNVDTLYDHIDNKTDIGIVILTSSKRKKHSKMFY